VPYIPIAEARGFTALSGKNLEKRHSRFWILRARLVSSSSFFSAIWI